MSERDETAQKLSELGDRLELTGGEDSGDGPVGGLLEGVDTDELQASQLGSIGESLGRNLGGMIGRRIGEFVGREFDLLGGSSGSSGASGEEEGDEQNGEGENTDDLDEMSTEELQGLADDLSNELEERSEES